MCVFFGALFANCSRPRKVGSFLSVELGPIGTPRAKQTMYAYTRMRLVQILARRWQHCFTVVDNLAASPSAKINSSTCLDWLLVNVSWLRSRMCLCTVYACRPLLFCPAFQVAVIVSIIFFVGIGISTIFLVKGKVRSTTAAASYTCNEIVASTPWA